MHNMKWSSYAAALFAATMMAACVDTQTQTQTQAPSGARGLAQEAACRTLDIASIGAPAPSDPNTLVIRWLAGANYELAYRDSVFIFDTHFDHKPWARKLGFDYKKIANADAIFIGHPHSDHVSEVVPVARQTGAPVYMGPPGIKWALSVGLPPEQAKTVKGGEKFEINGITVQPVLAQHSERDHGDMTIPQNRAKAGYDMVLKTIPDILPPLTPEQVAHEKERMSRNRGISGNAVAVQGTIGFMLTFPDGFRLYYQDTTGAITPGHKAIMKDIPGVDVGLLAYQGRVSSEAQLIATMPFVDLFKPRILLPTHHDYTGGTHTDMATYPLFMAAHDKYPGMKGIELLYREPLCINTETRETFVGGDPNPPPVW